MVTPKNKKLKRKAYKHKETSGRPRKFKSVKELQDKVDEYFKNPINYKSYVVGGEKFDIPVLTVCGLAYYLGFMDRQSIYDYIKLKDEYSCIIKKAKFFIESQYEAMLQGNNPTGVIFALKNMGWKDKFIVDDSETEFLFEKFKDMTNEELDEYYKSL